MLLAALQFVEWSRSLGRRLRGGFFSLLFLASKNYGLRTSKRAKGRLRFCFFFSFFLSFFSFKYLLHTRGWKKKWLSKLRVNGEQKTKKGRARLSCRQGTNRKQRRIKKRGGRGAERGSPRQKSKQRWLQERHFSATCRKKRNRISQEPRATPLRRARGRPARPRPPLSAAGAFPAPACAWEVEATNGVYPCSSSQGSRPMRETVS